MDASSATAATPGSGGTPTRSMRRAGWVLVIVGVLDIAYMAYCFARGISYASSLNIFAVIAGILLLRGDLRTASRVRWVAAFFLALVCAAPFVVVASQPVDLTITQIRLTPGSVGATAAMTVFFAGLLYWVVRELGRPDVVAAQAAAGRTVGDMRVSLALGVVVTIVAMAGILMMGRSETADRAQAIAAAQYGSGYRYHTSSLSIRTNSRGTHVTASVTAWNQQEVRPVPVEWDE